MTNNNPTNVAEAAVYLDSYDPGWYDRIDLDILRYDPHSVGSVLAQLCGDWHIYHPLYKKAMVECWVKGIFDDDAQPFDWINEVRVRKGLSPISNPYWNKQAIKANEQYWCGRGYEPKVTEGNPPNFEE